MTDQESYTYDCEDNLRKLKNRLVDATSLMATGGRDNRELWGELVKIAEKIIEDSFDLGRAEREENRKETQRIVDKEQERSRQLYGLLKKAARQVKRGRLLGEIEAVLIKQPKKLRGRK